MTVLLAVLLTGCAIGHVVRPDGTRLAGIAVGAAALECCEADGWLGADSEHTSGPLVGRCARINGGTLSETFSALFSGLISGAAAYFGGGLW